MEGQDLNNFQWDDSVPSIDFFGETVSNPNKTAVAVPEIKSPEDQDDKGDTGTTKLGDDATAQKDDDPEIDFFGESNKGNDSDDTDDSTDDTDDDADEKPKGSTKIKDTEDQDNDTPVLNNVGVANYLKEKGFIDFELEEGQELDDLEAEALIEDAFDESVEQRLEDTIAGLPEAVKNLVKFAAKGGDVDQYLASISQTTSQGVSKTMDMTKEANQEKFMRYKLEQEGNDEEYIEFQIEAMKESGKLETLATKAFGTWKKAKDIEDEKLVEEQKKRVKQAQQNAINFRRDITKHISEVGSVKGLKFTRQDIRELPDYITNATETLEDGRQVAPFYKDLGEALKDKDKVAIMAKLLKSDFSFKDIEKAAATKVTQTVKNNIQRQQQNNKNISTAGGGSQAKRLADYFND